MKRFITIWILLAGLCFFCWMCAFAKDEGTIPEGVLFNFFAEFFVVFDFPTHMLFWDWLYDGNWDFYTIFFAINITLDSVMIVGLIKSIKMLFFQKPNINRNV